MSPEIKAAMKLQDLDLKAAALEKEIATLPKQVAHIEKQLDAALRKLDVDQAALVGNQRERKKLEDDIKVQDQKISKLKDQTLGAKTNEQYKAFQHEIEFCQAEIRKAEDRILELMTESEPLDKAVKTAQALLKKEKDRVEQEKDKARQRTEEDQKFLAQIRDDRAKVVSGLDPKFQQHYERIRKRWHGVVIADATDGRCSACRIALRPQFFQDLRHSEKVQFCESCGRILLYNPPVNLEHEMHSVRSAN